MQLNAHSIFDYPIYNQNIVLAIYRCFVLESVVIVLAQEKLLGHHIKELKSVYRSEDKTSKHLQQICNHGSRLQ